MKESPYGYHALVKAFASGERRFCPLCDAPVSGIRLYDKSDLQTYSLYVDPCGHRLGLWPKAPDWATQAGIVQIVRSDDGI